MDKWIDIALFFLVASCPCSLVISIPLSFFSCIGAISKKGMIIKGTKHIENLSKTDIIAFDKTGNRAFTEKFPWCIWRRTGRVQVWNHSGLWKNGRKHL